jgi:hypothetical protein
MKSNITSIAVAVAATFLFAQDAFAQDGKSNYPGLLSGTQIKGAEVMDLQNQEIGSIEEVLGRVDEGELRRGGESDPRRSQTRVYRTFIARFSI